MMQASQLLQSIWTHPANQGRRGRCLVRAIAWQVSKRLSSRPWDIPYHHGRLRCFPDSPVSSAAIYFSGWPDWWEMQFLARYLRPGDRFIDVGANIGLYSILAAGYVGPSGRIDAFEPDARCAQRLCEQAQLNDLPHLHVHRHAVHSHAGTVQFGWSANDAMAHVRRTSDRDAPVSPGVQVSTIALDGFEPYGPYAAGKMDIEGAEPMALEGAARRLSMADPPVWILELAGYSRLYGVESHELVERLAGAGFDCAVYHPGRKALEYTARPWDLNVQNVLAIARSHRGFVETRLAGPHH